jgi:hypothetical protein
MIWLELFLEANGLTGALRRTRRIVLWYHRVLTSALAFAVGAQMLHRVILWAVG